MTRSHCGEGSIYYALKARTSLPGDRWWADHGGTAKRYWTIGLGELHRVQSKAWLGQPQRPSR